MHHRHKLLKEKSSNIPLIYTLLHFIAIDLIYLYDLTFGIIIIDVTTSLHKFLDKQECSS